MTPVLEGKNVLLVPMIGAEDNDYFYRLVMDDERRVITFENLMKIKELFCKYTWAVYTKGRRFGIGLGLFVNGQWILEGLKDKLVKGVPFAYSIEAGQLMRDFLFTQTDILFTYARVEQGAIQYLCEKLGFENVGIQQGLVIYRKEKVCQSFQQ